MAQNGKQETGFDTKQEGGDHSRPISRRSLVLGITATGAISTIGGVGGMLYSNRFSVRDLPIVPEYFLQIATDDTVTVVSKHLEMGQGITTGLAMLAAEELDADWSMVKAVQAPANREMYFNGQWGRQETAASSGMSNSWIQMRMVGAAAREMLVGAAADHWSVSAGEVSINNGIIRHDPSGKEVGFGSVAEQAMRREVPAAESLKLKSPSQWRLIGQSLKRLDTKEKIEGSATFALDVKRPGMVYAVVLRSPRFGGKLSSCDATKALSVPGVLEVVEIPDAVAVIADNTWSAMRGRGELVATWDDSVAETRSSSDIFEDYDELSRSEGVVAIDHGDVELALENAPQTIEFEFRFPYLAHTPMEPLSCVMERTSNGIEVWAGCQAHTLEQEAVASVFGIRPDDVKINTMFAGASFGRRTFPQTDWIPELAHIVKNSALMRPIQLVWTREDDIRGGAYRPLAYHRGRAGLDESGSIVGWSHDVVCQSLVVGTPWSYKLARQGLDYATIGGIRYPQYDIPNRRLEVHSPKSPVTVSFWRSVGNSHNAFVLETFVDELAHMAGKDPLEFRLQHTKNQRQRTVLEEARRLSGWPNNQMEKSGLGVAMFSEANRAGATHMALVSEVSVDEDTINIHRIVAVVDCGLAVNPALVESQVEGSIGFALSTALRNEISLEDGIVQQSNFHDYEPTRMSETPKIDIHIVESGSTPFGVGEGAVSLLSPSLGNAIFAASGERLRQLPFRLSSA